MFSEELLSAKNDVSKRFAEFLESQVGMFKSERQKNK